MKRLQLITTIVAILLLVTCGVTIFAWSTTSGTLDKTRNNLADTSTQFTLVQSELDNTQQSLEKTQTDLSNTGDELKATEGRLLEQEEDLSKTQDKLEVAESSLADTSKQLTTAIAQASEATKQASEATIQKVEAQVLAIKYKEIVDGLGISVNTTAQAKLKDLSINLVDNPNAVNPTLAQLEMFLKSDKSENHAYIEDVYDCSQFSEHLHNDAEADGIRCFVVHIEIPNSVAILNRYTSPEYNIKHALNAFITTDYGLIYIDDTAGHDTLARIAVGYKYLAIDISYNGIQDDVLRHLRDYEWWDNWWENNPDVWSLGWFMGIYTNIVSIALYL